MSKFALKKTHRFLCSSPTPSCAGPPCLEPLGPSPSAVPASSRHSTGTHPSLSRRVVLGSEALLAGPLWAVVLCCCYCARVWCWLPKGSGGPHAAVGEEGATGTIASWSSPTLYDVLPELSAEEKARLRSQGILVPEDGVIPPIPSHPRPCCLGYVSSAPPPLLIWVSDWLR
jgi:hypothetical protein